MQNNEKKNYEGAESEETKKNKEKSFNSTKEFGKGSFIYHVLKKCLKFGPPRPSSLLCTSLPHLMCVKYNTHHLCL